MKINNGRAWRRARRGARGEPAGEDARAGHHGFVFRGLSAWIQVEGGGVICSVRWARDRGDWDVDRDKDCDQSGIRLGFRR